MPRRKPDPNLPHTVYMHLDAKGTVLYVGMTYNLEQRTRDHAYCPYWANVASVEVDSVHPNRATAAARERELIFELRPRRNWAGNPDFEYSSRVRLLALRATEASAPEAVA